jgi:hypothetical protein
MCTAFPQGAFILSQLIIKVKKTTQRTIWDSKEVVFYFLFDIFKKPYLKNSEH